MSREDSTREAIIALDWHIENAVDEIWAEEAVSLLDQTPVKSLVSNAEKPSSRHQPHQKQAPKKQEFVASPTLEGLYQQIRDFEECDLKETAINTVIADGNPESKIMVIGEAPGAEEDRTGVPFVGAAGQLLDKMLLPIGLDRSNTLISNMVFWRPPGNRKPTLQESDMCLQFTKRHIELVKPKILILVGALSAQKILNTSDGITRLRGKWFDYKTPDGSDVLCMPLLHPAYLLRQPRYKRETWIDLLEIKKKVIELNLPML